MMLSFVKGCFVGVSQLIKDEKKRNLTISLFRTDPNQKARDFKYLLQSRKFPLFMTPLQVPTDPVQQMLQAPLIAQRIIQVPSYRSQNKQIQINSIQYEANNKIQDRLVVTTLKSLKAQFVSVFDGHGGDKLSDYCANHVVELVDYFVEHNMNHEKYINDLDKLISDSLIYSYEKIDKDFYENVYKSHVSLNNKKIKGVGSCALSVTVYKNKIYVANSGDSEAIAVCRQNDDKISYFDLNERFSVNNPLERERLKKQFPQDQDIVVQERTGCYYVKGRLQPTRALGDYHLKFGHLYKGKGKFNGPYIQCTPDVKVFDITDNLQTIVVASDGVWDFVSKDIVAEASLQKSPHQRILQKSLSKVAELHRKSVSQIRQISNQQKRSFHDDISIAVINLGGSKKQRSFI